MAEKKRFSIPVSFEKIEDVQIEDNRFTKVKIWMMHTGQNYNGSCFEESVIEEAIPTLQYIPIVGFIEENENEQKDFSDHRFVLTKTENGVEEKYLGSAYGVITSIDDNNAHFESRTDDEGIERKYLVVEGVLWNMFSDSSEIMNNDLIKSQSMELDPDNYEGYEDENGIFHFVKFSFRASCILGTDYEPGMAGSTIEVVNFSLSNFSRSIQREIENKFAALFTHTKKKESQGGVTPIMDNNTKFNLTAVEQWNEISNIIVGHAKFTDNWGDEVSRYSLVDIQDNTVIMLDRQDNYNLYGAPLFVADDKVSIDFNSCKRMKTSYTEMNVGSSEPDVPVFEIGNIVKEVSDKFENKIKDISSDLEDMKVQKDNTVTEFEKVKADLDNIKPKYEEFVKMQEEKNAQEIEDKKNELFSKFETALGDNEEFKKLKEEKDKYSVEDIEGKCAVMYCRKNNLSNFSKKKSAPNTVGLPDEDEPEIGFVSTKYGDIPIE